MAVRAGCASLLLIGTATFGAQAANSNATIQATTFTAETISPAEAVAVCPGATRAVGGGVVPSGSPNAFLLQASGPLDKTGVTLETNDGDKAKQWYVSVFNYDNKRRTLRAFALCSKSSKATIEAKQFKVGAGKIAEAFAKCPAGKRALGGGVVQSGAADMIVMASGPLDPSRDVRQTGDGDRAKFWYAAIDNEDGETQRTLRVFAICAEDSAATIEATSFKVGAQDTAQANAMCPGQKRAVGGGVVQVGAPGNIFVLASGPLDASGKAMQTETGDKAKQWYVFVSNLDVIKRTVKVFAICE